MPDTDLLGTETMPYDPADPLHKAIVGAEEIIKAGEAEIKDDKKPTLSVILDAVKELTKTVGELAKGQQEMKERHDKWIKAGKF